MSDPKKGTDIAENLLMMQYQDSPIFKSYLAAFVDEMDWLFESIEDVFLGRFLETAIGAQLDVIGIILNEFRGVSLPTQFFGFSSDDGLGGGVIPTADVAPLADEAVPADGGIFRSEGQSHTGNFSLSDEEFRRLLLAKASIISKEVCMINDAYHAISTLLGRTPQLMKIVTLAPRQVQLQLLAADTTLANVSLISYFSKYLVPLGTSFTISRT